MAHTVGMGIRTKFTALFLVISLSSVALLGFIAYRIIHNQVVETKIDKLRDIVVDKEHSLRYMAMVWKDRAAQLAGHAGLQKALSDYAATPSDANLQAIEASLTEAYRTIRNIKHIQICALEGAVVARFGVDSAGTPTCNVVNPLPAAPYTIDKFWIDPNDYSLHVLVSSAVVLNGNRIAVAQIVFDGQEFIQFIGGHAGLGTSGEIVVAETGPDGEVRFITPLRFEPDPELSLTISANKNNVPIISALRGRKLTFSDAETIDYRGESVFAATGYLPEYKWGLVAKMDRAEALEPVDALSRTILLIVGGLSVLIILAGAYFGQLISWPLVHLSAVAKRVTAGDLSQKADIAAKDEIGQLAQNFNEMTEALAAHTAEIEEHRRRIQAVLETTVDGIITIDENGTIETFNAACERLFGYSAEEVIGKNVRLLMPEPHGSAHDHYIENYRRTGRPRIIGIGRELQGQRKDGSIFEMDLSVSVVNLKEKRLFTGIIRDISERKRAEHHLNQVMEQLRDTNAELEHFAYAASHDLKSPLRAVSFLTQILLEDFGDTLDDNKQDIIQRIQISLARMNKLVEDLLIYATLGSAALDTQTIPADQLIEEIVDFLEKPAGITVEIDPALSALHIPRVPLAQVFQNLIGNAIKHHDNEAGKIQITGRMFGSYAEFSVRDDGPGIAPDYHDRIFEVFITLKPKDQVEGSGMGLAMVKKIVERFGGTIRVESDGLRGSVFTFDWPHNMRDPEEDQNDVVMAKSA